MLCGPHLFGASDFAELGAESGPVAGAKLLSQTSVALVLGDDALGPRASGGDELGGAGAGGVEGGAAGSSAGAGGVGARGLAPLGPQVGIGAGGTGTGGGSGGAGVGGISVTTAGAAGAGAAGAGGGAGRRPGASTRMRQVTGGSAVWHAAGAAQGGPADMDADDADHASVAGVNTPTPMNSTATAAAGDDFGGDVDCIDDDDVGGSEEGEGGGGRNGMTGREDAMSEEGPVVGELAKVSFLCTGSCAAPLDAEPCIQPDWACGGYCAGGRRREEPNHLPCWAGWEFASHPRTGLAYCRYSFSGRTQRALRLVRCRTL